jgi:hypothetical protein
MRGDRGGSRAEYQRRGGIWASQLRVGRAAARRRDDAWSIGRQGVGTGKAATASGDEDQLGQEAKNVAERGEASAGVGSGGAEVGMARGKILSGVEVAGRRTWPGSGGGGVRQRRSREEGERGRQRGT